MLMTSFRALGVAGAILVLSAGAAAGQTTTSLPIGVAVRTLAPFPFGVDAAVAISPKVNVRVGLNFFKFSHDFDDDGIEIAAKLNLSGFDTHVDWYPLGGTFHVSPGILLYNNIAVEGDATVEAGRSFDLGDGTFISNPVDPVTGLARVGFKRVAPSLLIGWGNVVPRGDRRWSVPFEIGFIYSKAPTASLALTGSACAPDGSNCRDIESDPILQNEVETEISKLNEDLEVFTFIPVISLGFSFRF